MHEVFLTAIVPDADIERAKALLQGLSGMSAYAGIHRVLYFSGPIQPRGLTVKRSIPMPLQPPQMRLWSELHQNLNRQSFVLQVRYPLKQSEFGYVEEGPAKSGSTSLSPSSATSMGSLNSSPATLCWTDIPDPTVAANGGNPMVVQRKKIEITETKNLPAILQDNNHTLVTSEMYQCISQLSHPVIRFKSELIEESFAFFTNNTEYALVRYHRLPAISIPISGRPDSTSVPIPVLPTWEEVLYPTSIPNVDPSGQWFLFVRRHVLEDTSPEKMAKAVEELEGVRTQLASVFVFRSIDRRAHDTRLERPVNNMPAPLPQKVRA